MASLLATPSSSTRIRPSRVGPCSWKTSSFDLSFRKNKVGRALLSRVAAIAQQEDRFGVMLHVLDWNEMAIQFYKKMDATFLDNWKTVCLKGDVLRLVAHPGPDI